MEKNLLESLTPDELPVLLPSHPDDEETKSESAPNQGGHSEAPRES